MGAKRQAFFGLTRRRRPPQWIRMENGIAGRESILDREPVRKGRHVLYWMQASQRATENPALDAAIARANSLGLPVVCLFGLTAAIPEANLRHHAFMIEGIAETRASLARMGITQAVLRAEPDEAALSVADQAAMIVCDCGCLRHQRRWRARPGSERRNLPRARDRKPHRCSARQPEDGTAARLHGRQGLELLCGGAWCFGLHDRPWQERPIFGMVRYVNESGLRRWFDIEGYARRIESLGKERT